MYFKIKSKLRAGVGSYKCLTVPIFTCNSVIKDMVMSAMRLWVWLHFMQQWHSSSTVVVNFWYLKG